MENTKPTTQFINELSSNLKSFEVTNEKFFRIEQSIWLKDLEDIFIGEAMRTNNLSMNIVDYLKEKFFDLINNDLEYRIFQQTESGPYEGQDVVFDYEILSLNASINEEGTILEITGNLFVK